MVWCFIASIWQSIVGRRRLNSDSGRARGGIAPRLHREITLESARLRRTPRPPRPPQGSPSYGSSAPAPAPEVPDSGPHWSTGQCSTRQPGSLLGRQPHCRVPAGEAESEQSGSSPPPTTTHRPPFPVLYGRNTCCMVHGHGAWGMEHGAWNDGARPVLGSAAVRCGAGAMWCYSRLPPPFCHCVSHPEAGLNTVLV
jgi:hypothetical protein